MQNKYYQHKYGGIYEVNFDNIIKKVDKCRYVVYTHVYPFEVTVQSRLYDEFVDGRFREISQGEFNLLMAIDRLEFQEIIIRNKASGK